MDAPHPQPLPSTMSFAMPCTGDKKVLARQLITWGLIPPEGQYICKKCGDSLKLTSDTGRPDGLRWRCGGYIQKPRQKRQKCSVTVEFRHGTFFDYMKLSMFQCLTFVHFWVSHLPLTFACEDLGISMPTAVDWASFCREVVLHSYIVNKQKLGGFGKIVEIDESKFGKRKYHRGHRVEGQWVFGGYERGTGRVFMVPVENRSVDTLLPIIKDWVHEGTTIISDYWKANDCLSSTGYEHLKVNHSLTFKDPDTGAHTNAIESSWRAAKSTMSSSGRRKAHIPGNLARYIFQKRCAELKLNRTVEFFRLAGQLYNPLNPTVENDDEHTDISDDE